MDSYLNNINSLSGIGRGQLKNSMRDLGSKEMDEESLKKSCRDFETIFIQRMFNEMLKTTKMGEQFGKGAGGDFFKDMFTQQISEDLSKRSPIGIADQMYNQLKERFGEKKKIDKSAIRNIDNSDRLHNVVLNNKGTTKNTTIDEIDISGSAGNYISNNFEKNIKININQIDRYDSIIELNAEKFGVDSALVKSVIKNESNGDYKAVSSQGAKGLMQLMDSTAKELGVSNPFNADQNIAGGTKYLKQMLDRYDNDMEKALAAYNAGPGNVDKYQGIPPFEETQKYVKRVMKSFESYSDDK